MIPLDNQSPSTAATTRVARRILDLLLSGFGMLIAAPLLAIASAAIKLEDRGPVIYRRRVLGVGGGEFDAYKLRTMRVGSDLWLSRNAAAAEVYQRNLKLREDPRVTRVGRLLRRYSVDEIPQLWNVLRGQMTLVGPRMIHPSEFHRFGELGPRILRVKPGLTGLWQVSGRQNLTFDERLVLDRRYLDERSLWLDLFIIGKTLPAVLRGRGAF